MYSAYFVCVVYLRLKERSYYTKFLLVSAVGSVHVSIVADHCSSKNMDYYSPIGVDEDDNDNTESEFGPYQTPSQYQYWAILTASLRISTDSEISSYLLINVQVLPMPWPRLAKLVLRHGIFPILAPFSRNYNPPLWYVYHDEEAIGYLTTRRGGAIMGKTQELSVLKNDIRLAFRLAYFLLLI